MSEKFWEEYHHYRNMPKKRCYAWIGTFLVKFYKDRNIQHNEKIFYTNSYLENRHDFYYERHVTLENIFEAQKYFHKKFRSFYKASELHTILDFVKKFFIDGYGEKYEDYLKFMSERNEKPIK